MNIPATIDELRTALAYERSARQKAEQQVGDLICRGNGDIRQIEYLYRELHELQVKFD